MCDEIKVTVRTSGERREQRVEFLLPVSEICEDESDQCKDLSAENGRVPFVSSYGRIYDRVWPGRVDTAIRARSEASS